jgi:hypothetical protein
MLVGDNTVSYGDRQPVQGGNYRNVLVAILSWIERRTMTRMGMGQRRDGVCS